MRLPLLTFPELNESASHLDLGGTGSCVVASNADHQPGGMLLVPLVLLPDLSLESDQAREEARLNRILFRALLVLSKSAVTMDGETGCLREAKDQARSMHWEEVS